MKILDDHINRECKADDTEECPDPTGVKFSFVALMVYMVIANVLLINLLIAMFRYVVNMGKFSYTERLNFKNLEFRI